MDQSKIANLNPQDYTHLPHADQKFEEHEQTDVAIRPLVWTLISIALIIIVSAVGMWGLFRVFKYTAENNPENQRMSAVETTGFRHVPEGLPELQGIFAQGGNPNSPAQDTARMKAHNAEMLAGRAPLRDGLKTPEMSIEQAMQTALDKKIFKTAPGAAGKQATR
jgi:hypothetical protein